MRGVLSLSSRTRACYFVGPAIVFTLFGPPALSRQASTGSAAGAYYLYGLVCGECDAARSKSAAIELQSTSYALSYLANPIHRQELPRGEALSLVRRAQRAGRHGRQVYLSAFAAGYKQGWRQTAQHMKQVSESAPGSANSPRMGDPDDRSLVNLQRLGIAVWLYLVDHNNTFPRMANPTVTDKYFQQYVVDPRIFYEPGTQDAYQPNLALENKHMTSYTNWGKVVVFYEPNPAADGSRCVLFIDGSVARVSAAEWQKVKKDSGVVDNLE